jgi:hypothetical protein
MLGLMSRFEFAFPLPEDLRASDWHENARITHELFATVVGITAQSSSRGILQSFRSTSPSAAPSRAQSPVSVRSRGSPASSRAASRSPSPQPIDPTLGGPSFASMHLADHIPQTPAYEDIASQTLAEAMWLEGSLTGKRDVKVVWNPNPAGGVSSLDQKVVDRAGGLGDYEVHFKAPIVSPSIVHALTYSGPYAASYILGSDSYSFHQLPKSSASEWYSFKTSESDRQGILNPKISATPSDIS